MKKVIFLTFIIFIVLLSYTAYAKYVVTKNFDINIGSSPFYFYIEPEALDLNLVNNETSFYITLKNYENSSNYNSFDTTYEISLENENTFSLTIEDSNNQTLLGGKTSNNTILLKLKTDKTVSETTTETVNLKIISKSPYTKEQILPLTVTINPDPVEFSMAYGRIEILWLDTNNEIKETPNEPNLGNMTPVKWNNFEEIETTSSDSSWYNYISKSGKDDNLDSQWANAKNSDGSYFVWIPRYAYRITYYESISSDTITGYCDGDGIKEVTGNVRYGISDSVQTVVSNGKSYIVHPAFTDGTNNNFQNGEWDSELSGIWVAKFEMSMETNGVHTETDSLSIGNVLISDSIKAVSKPNVSSWRNISISNCYTNAYTYDSSQNSHLMKNSEWGAVAYLAHSPYGRNGNKLDINNSSDCITGNGSGSTDASVQEGLANAYNTTTGAKASSTGNIYGVYDLSGGAWERTAAYISNGSSYFSEDGSSFVATTSANSEAYKTLSTKFATVYPYNASNDTSATNYEIYRNAEYGYGDAILETSLIGETNTSWHGERSNYAHTNYPFFSRGGNNNNGTIAGLLFFTTYGTGDNPNNYSYRVVLTGPEL